MSGTVYRVLLVDDEPAIRQGYARLLVAAGYEVEVAEDGQSAVDMLDRAPFDIVISDISMPGLDGIQLLKTIALRDPDIPVVLVTGCPTLDSAINAVQYGAFHYLTKPFRKEELILVVQRATRLRQLARLKSQALSISGLPGGRAGGAEILEAALDRALGSLWMAFQPIVRCGDGSLCAYEALLRVDDPALPGPGAVLYAAERLARVHEVGRLVRAKAVVPMASAPTDALLFLNLHPRDLLDEELVSAESPLARLAPRTVLEITERASLDGVDNLRGRLRELRRMGFRIPVDDLGAGYAGLTSFAALEPEFVKIDMTLVRGVDRDPRRRKLICALVDVCRDIGGQIVAEGIETIGERDALIDTGCDLLQGYHIARPGPPFPSIHW